MKNILLIIASLIAIAVVVMYITKKPIPGIQETKEAIKPAAEKFTMKAREAGPQLLKVTRQAIQIRNNDGTLTTLPNPVPFYGP